MQSLKRKCEKGGYHQDRYIEAVCLEESCKTDRLLCFYCIHQSHENHSIAYLINGLNSPLEQLNRNSKTKNPQKDLKKIERRLIKINNGWLKISDLIEDGINEIANKMTPQFNVIRQTFKKDSVDNIIRELTSLEVTREKIQAYVNMINMVKRYKFNDIKKLRSTAYFIENKLSIVFTSAQKKINQIMQGVIRETDLINFVNFDVNKVINSREIFLALSKNLKIQKVVELDFNYLTLTAKSDKIPYSQIDEQEAPNSQQEQEFFDISQSKFNPHQKLVQNNEPNQKMDEQKQISIQKQNKPEIDKNLNNTKQKNSFQNKDNFNLKVQNQTQAKENVNWNYHIPNFLSNQKRQQKQIEDGQISDIDSSSNIKIKSSDHSVIVREQIVESSISDNKNIQFYSQKSEEQFHDYESDQYIDYGEDLENHYRLESDEEKQKVRKQELNMQAEQIQKKSLQKIKEEDQNHKIIEVEQNNQIAEVQQIKKSTEDYQAKKSPNEQKIQQYQSIQKDQQIPDMQPNQRVVNEAYQQFSCQFPPIDLDQQIASEPFSQETIQICSNFQIMKPSYRFSISITSQNSRKYFQQCLDQFDIEQSKLNNQDCLVEIINHENLFPIKHGYQCKNQEELMKKVQFQNLKRYFICQPPSQDSDLSEQTITQSPKRKKPFNQNIKYVSQTLVLEEDNFGKKKTKVSFNIQNVQNVQNVQNSQNKIEKINNPSQVKVNNLYQKQKIKISLLPLPKQKQPEMIQEEILKPQRKQSQRIKNRMQQEVSYQNEKIHKGQKLKESGSNHQSQKKLQINSIFNNQKDIQPQYYFLQKEDQQFDWDADKQVQILQKISQKDQFSQENQIQKKSDVQNQVENSKYSNNDQYGILQIFNSSSQRQFFSDNSSQEKLYRQKRIEKERQNLPPIPFQKNSIAPMTKKVRNAKIYGSSVEEIKKRLHYIDPLYIRSLSIYCDTEICALFQDSVNIICDMVNLEALNVYWAYKLSKSLVKKIIEKLSKLKQLVLCQYNQFDLDIARQIVKHLPNLKRLHYASDFLKYLDKIEENSEFFLDMTTGETNISALCAISGLKHLQTLWLSQVSDLRQAKQIIKKVKNLKQITLVSYQKKAADYNPILQTLSQFTTLRSICLQCVNFKQEHLIEIIRKNTNLNTFILNQCPSVSDLTIDALVKNCPKLQQFYMMLTDSPTGQKIFELSNLKTLVIRASWGMNPNKFKEGLKKLKKLTTLCVNMNNYWLQDDIMPSIACLTNLKVLNIDSTKISDKGLMMLTGLQNLTTLIFGRTEVSEKGFVSFFQKSASKIAKLGLSRQNSQELQRKQKLNKHDVIFTELKGNILIRIGELLPLTHLSIIGFQQVKIQHFATLSELKCLEYKIDSLDEETEQFLQKISNLFINANY